MHCKRFRKDIEILKYFSGHPDAPTQWFVAHTVEVVENYLIFI